MSSRPGSSLPRSPRPRSPRLRLAYALCAGAALAGAALAMRTVGPTLRAQRPPTAYLPVVQKNAARDDPAQQATPTAATAAPATATRAPSPTPPPAGPDALGEALGSIGLQRSDLGYRPSGDWTRWPLLERTEFLLPLFRPIYAQPLRAYDAARTLGNAADAYMRPGALAAGEIHKLAYYLGADRWTGNNRAYSANVYVGALSKPGAVDPLREAVRDLLRYADADTLYSFGGVPSAPDIETVLDRELAGLPPALQGELGLAVMNQLDALRWRDRALREADPIAIRRSFDVRDLGDSQGDGATWYPQFPLLMRGFDAPAMLYAGQKAFETAHQLRLRASALAPADRCPTRPADIPTPFGRILVGTCGADRYDGDDVFLLLDPGGDDIDASNAGGTAHLETGVALAVDLGGNDRYDAAGVRAGCAQGCGILGVGVLVDGAGDDVYAADHHAQGAGQAGYGVLLDVAGADDYTVAHTGQGAAFFGYGALFDAAGDDRYHAFFDSQGYGGVGGGVGVLADRLGDDLYDAEPDARKLPARYQYRNYAGNGQPNTVVSFVQGTAAGRRADGSDGHAWAGGLGAIVDVEGNDHYRAGAFAQGYGYWYGIGLMYDGRGDDVYDSVYYSIASGAHFSVAAIVDEAGDDAYEQSEAFEGAHAGAGVAFAWDFVTALIVDRGGDDRYASNANAVARTAENGNALLVDLAGDDTYVTGAGQAGQGSSSWAPYRAADPLNLFRTGRETSVIALLLDLGGRDVHQRRDFRTGALTDHPAAGDDRAWADPDPSALTSMGTTYGWTRTFGLGVDRQGGTVPELNVIPAPTPVPAGQLAAPFDPGERALDAGPEGDARGYTADPYGFAQRRPDAPGR